MPEDLLHLQANALEATANPVLISRRDGTIIWVNKAFESLSGYSRDEAIGQSTRLLKSGLLPAAFYKEMWDAILSGSQWRGELINRRKDGTLYHEEMTITPVKNDFGEITHFIAIKLDITERKREEERVCRLAQAVENSAELIAITEADGRISYANQALLKMTGYRENEILGKLFKTTLLSPNNPEGLDETILSHTMHMGAWRGECLSCRKDGTNFPTFLSTGVIKDDRGVTIGLFGIAEDITDRKKLEKQLIASQKMEAVGRLAGGIAHDFNNLMQLVMGYSDLALAALPPDNPQSHQVRQIKKASLKAITLTRQLLAYSRKQVVQPRVLDVNRLIVDFENMLHRIIGDDIRLETNLKSEPGNIRADAGQIEQVILNLVVNSRDAMPQGGKLTIETANVDLDEAYCRSHPAIYPGRYVMIAISDSGTGMDVQTQARIFDPFFTTKEQGKGTGLGLSTVYGIVKQSEGFIWVYSELGKGTIFKIYFPRIDDPAQADRMKKTSPEIVGGSETVLLVEDSEPLRELTCTLLQKNGYSVLVAESAHSALALAEGGTQPFQLLLTDVVMPAVSGRELAERLRASQPNLKVLFMSGYSSDIITTHGILQPGISFIQKPFSERSLMIKLREVLDSAAKH